MFSPKFYLVYFVISKHRRRSRRCRVNGFNNKNLKKITFSISIGYLLRLTQCLNIQLLFSNLIIESTDPESSHFESSMMSMLLPSWMLDAEKYEIIYFSMLNAYCCCCCCYMPWSHSFEENMRENHKLLIT